MNVLKIQKKMTLLVKVNKLSLKDEIFDNVSKFSEKCCLTSRSKRGVKSVVYLHSEHKGLHSSIPAVGPKVPGKNPLNAETICYLYLCG